MSKMTDLEMTKLCAEAMKYEVNQKYPPHESITAAPLWGYIDGIWTMYRPLEDDDQAMALMKKFRLTILADHGEYDNKWCVSFNWEYPGSINESLNRAIVDCVARMQAKKRNKDG